MPMMQANFDEFTLLGCALFFFVAAYSWNERETDRTVQRLHHVVCYLAPACDSDRECVFLAR